MTNDNQPTIEKTINTDGGASIEGNVNIGRDFVGRDQITVIVHSPESADKVFAEQARKATLLAGAFTRQPFEPECVLVSPQKTTSSDFYIGKCPVTNAQYAEFLSENPVQPVPRRVGWHLKRPPMDKADHPVVGVSQYEAIAYCTWLSEVTSRSYRLLSQAEWEYAARGPAAYRYPWGDEWQENVANVDSHDTTSVTAHPDGASPYGCQDMLGNVQEWTATHTARGEYVHCGGCYRDMAQNIHCGLYDTGPAETKVEWRGFRVLLEIE